MLGGVTRGVGAEVELFELRRRAACESRRCCRARSRSTKSRCSREANAARICERQRSQFELPAALPNALRAFDRAYASTALIEVAVRNLDFHAMKNVGETDALVADVSVRP